SVEEGHLLALLAQPPVYRLELCQEPRLALARVGRLRPLLPEALLRLLKRVLLVAELTAVFLRLARHGHRGQHHQEGDRHAQGGADHATNRPRARRPPRPPRTAPPTMSSRICGTERNTARARPSVSWSSGSSRGAPTA